MVKKLDVHKYRNASAREQRKMGPTMEVKGQKWRLGIGVLCSSRCRDGLLSG
jgi:hypothetical protein